MQMQADRQIPLSRIQKLIGSLMLASKRTRATGYFSVWADVTDLTAMRKKYCRKIGVRATTNDFILHAMARMMQQYPLMAAAIDEAAGELVIAEHFGVGFAVAAPQGLVVPVIGRAEEKTLPEIAAESDRLLKRARSNTLLPDDFDGANLVLSGLGMYGVEWFYAIAPPAATGIVSIGYIADQLVVRDGEVTVRKRINLSLAVDQRVADDFYAARFLRGLADQLEDPWSLANPKEVAAGDESGGSKKNEFC